MVRVRVRVRVIGFGFGRAAWWVLKRSGMKFFA